MRSLLTQTRLQARQLQVWRAVAAAGRRGTTTGQLAIRFDGIIDYAPLRESIKSLKRGLDDLKRSVDEVNAKKPRFFRGFCVEVYTKGWLLNPLGKRGDKSRHLKLRPHRPLSVRLWRQPVQAQTWTLPCHYPNHKKE